MSATKTDQAVTAEDFAGGWPENPHDYGSLEYARREINVCRYVIATTPWVDAPARRPWDLEPVEWSWSWTGADGRRRNTVVAALVGAPVTVGSDPEDTGNQNDDHRFVCLGIVAAAYATTHPDIAAAVGDDQRRRYHVSARETYGRRYPWAVIGSPAWTELAA